VTLCPTFPLCVTKDGSCPFFSSSLSQVAAKVSKTDENGAWILANVLGIDPMNEIYEVQDEDDPRRIITLNYGNLRRLTDNASDIRKGDRVLAVFPETTSFYRAVVVKTPKPLTAGSTGLWEVVVKFEDDEDDTGKPPARKVPSRFVIRSSAFAEEL
jgi:SAGA-associated factor 29